MAVRRAVGNDVLKSAFVQSSASAEHDERYFCARGTPARFAHSFSMRSGYACGHSSLATSEASWEILLRRYRTVGAASPELDINSTLAAFISAAVAGGSSFHRVTLTARRLWHAPGAKEAVEATWRAHWTAGPPPAPRQLCVPKNHRTIGDGSATKRSFATSSARVAAARSLGLVPCACTAATADEMYDAHCASDAKSPGDGPLILPPPLLPPKLTLLVLLLKGAEPPPAAWEPLLDMAVC